MKIVYITLCHNNRHIIPQLLRKKTGLIGHYALYAASRIKGRGTEYDFIGSGIHFIFFERQRYKKLTHFMLLLALFNNPIQNSNYSASLIT